MTDDIMSLDDLNDLDNGNHMITFKCQGKSFTVDKKILKGYLFNIVVLDSTVDEIDLSETLDDLTCETLDYILGYLQYHYDNPNKYFSLASIKLPDVNANLCEWDSNFLKTCPFEHAFNLALYVNYFMINNMFPLISLLFFIHSSPDRYDGSKFEHLSNVCLKDFYPFCPFYLNNH